MDKPAPADVSIHDLIARRWSPRAFADRTVSPDALRQLFEAARWAASSNNDQPWFYLVARREDAGEFQKMLECLVTFNQGWAKAASVLAISVARPKFAADGSPNNHARHDVGAASALLAIQATSLGLAVHQMAGFDAELTRKTFGIPVEYEPVAALAIGYPGDPASLPDKLREREMAPRARKSASEFVFSGAWNQKAPFIASGTK
jgi:nitroreductase